MRKMKGVTLLAFVAFIATIVPNRVEAGKCYYCGPKDRVPPGVRTCEQFDRASADEKKNNFIMDNKTPDVDCSRCWKHTEKGKGIFRMCKPNEVDLCEGDFCNGATGEAKSSKSTGKCYQCWSKSHWEFGEKSCEEFDCASVDERQTKFLIDSKTTSNEPLDCKRCATMKDKGEVVRRTCGLAGLDICEGDLCNGAGRSLGSRFWATALALALLATAIAILTELLN